MPNWMLAGVVASVVPTIFWLGGYNFDTRGPIAAICFYFTLVFYGLSLVILNKLKDD